MRDRFTPKERDAIQKMAVRQWQEAQREDRPTPPDELAFSPADVKILRTLFISPA